MNYWSFNLNILLITYYFPPCGAIGSKRWGEFFDISQENKNISFSVLTANWKGEKIENENIHYLGNEQIYMPSASINKEYSVLDILLHPTIAIRSIDRSLFSQWLKDVKNWISINRDKKFDYIISSYGPVATILAGSYAKKVFNVPLIVDLRDLISIQGQKKNIFGLNFFDKNFDKFITKDVDTFLTVSETCQKKAQSFYQKNCHLIYNGFNNYFEEDENINIDFKNKNSFKILYTGTLGKTRNPKTIMLIIDKYLKKNSNLNIQVVFASQDSPFDFIDKEDIKELKIEWLGYLSKDKLDEEKQSSDMFLLLEDLTEEGNENLTGKIFEYISSKKAIIASCNENSDIKKLLDKTKVGTLISNENDFEDFINTNLLWDIREINFYSRKIQFEKFLKVLSNV